RQLQQRTVGLAFDSSRENVRRNPITAAREDRSAIDFYGKRRRLLRARKSYRDFPCTLKRDQAHPPETRALRASIDHHRIPIPQLHRNRVERLLALTIRPPQTHFGDLN